MSTTLRTKGVLGGVLLLLVCCALFARNHAPAVAQEVAPKDSSPAPVENDMHEFMEYYFQPVYKDLKAAMTAEPKDNAGWLKIKAGSLTLAEGGNLILLRGPQEERDDWDAFAVAVRKSGSQMYRAAHDKNFDEVSANYRNMLGKCNACHMQFAAGEHQLSP